MATDTKRVLDLHARLGGGEHEFKSARSLLLTTLTKQQRSWTDVTQGIADGHLVTTDHAGNVISSETIYDILPDTAAVVLACHEIIGCGDDETQAMEAWVEIKLKLESAGGSWTDLTNLLDNGIETSEAWQPNLLDDLVGMLNEYVTFVRQPHDAIASALWVLHTFVYDRFQHTPRLTTFSQEPFSGKSVLVMHLMGELVRQPEKVIGDSGVAASLFWTIDADRPTMLLDEAQNAEVVGPLKSVINGGFDSEIGYITRRVEGGVKKYRVFSPFAFCWNKGSTSYTLHNDTLSRCLVLDFETAPLKKRYDITNVQQQESFARMRDRILRWALTCTLDTDPVIPPDCNYGRYHQCWRVLLSIADALGRGDVARKAAIAMSSRRMDESARIRLLRDIRTVFYKLKIKAIIPDALLEQLRALEACSLEAGEVWAFWKGETKSRVPHALTKQEMYAMLHSFGSKHNPNDLNTKSIRANPETGYALMSDKSGEVTRGYTLAQFIPFWEKHCPDNGNPQPTNLLTK
jgi:hypothetical protein